MRTRFSSGTGSTSFFAFQDIITAVTGIMVLIALLMAIQMTGGSPKTPPVVPELAAKLSRLSAERDELHLKVQSIRASAMPAESGREGILADVDNLEQMIRALNKESARLLQDAGKTLASSPSDIDIDALRKANREVSAEADAVERRNQQLAEEASRLANSVGKAEAAVLEVTANQSDVWLLPDRSDTTKEPVIITVDRREFVAQCLDAGAEKKSPRTSDLKQDLARLLEGRKPTDQFLVFYFKPSTLADFEAVKDAAKSLDYEIGYDILAEEGTVRFTTAAEGEDGQGAEQPAPARAAAKPSPGAESGAVVDIASEVEARGDPIGNGSGFFVSGEGHFVTNHHVVGEGGIFFVGSKNSGWRRAKLLRSDETRDLALLSVEHDSKPLHIAKSEDIVLGHTVATIGFPNIELQGFSPKFTKGEISSLAGIQDDPATFQISVPVQPGNSGGPLFDERGDVVGVVSARLNQDAAFALSGVHAENVNYAVKSSVLLDWLNEDPSLQSLLPPQGHDAGSFEKAIQEAEQSAAMILVYP